MVDVMGPTATQTGQDGDDDDSSSSSGDDDQSDDDDSQDSHSARDKVLAEFKVPASQKDLPMNPMKWPQQEAKYRRERAAARDD
jgi:hypothetical protein